MQAHGFSLVTAFTNMATINAEGVRDELHVLPKHLGGGPHGLGDPDDRSLRRVEWEVLIPKLMREKAKAEKCTEAVKAFNECCKEQSVLLVAKCRNENAIMKDCLVSWYQNGDFKNECKEIYLKERSEYRRTGVPKKLRNLETK